MQQPQHLTEHLRALLRADPHGAYVHVDDAALCQPLGSADRPHEPLAAELIAIKDNIDVAGLPTRVGRADYHPPPAARDAQVVARLRAAGATIVGKTAMHELALGITGENPRTGTPRNPFGANRLPGGSSSGSAVAVAAGLATFALGTDTGGSCRVPAALCGTVGFKPTFDRLPRDGVFPLSHRMDHVGILARQVGDVCRVMAFCDSSWPAPSADERVHPTGTLPLAEHAGRFALASSLFNAAHARVRETLDLALERLRASGFVMVPIPLPELLDVPDVYRSLLLEDALSVHAERLECTPQSFGDDVRALLLQGRALSEAKKKRARASRQRLAALLDRLFCEYDALLTPAALVTAPLVGQPSVDTGLGTLDTRRALLLPTCPFSMLGHPACVLPAGLVGGFPTALQIITAKRQDAYLLALCARLEVGLGCTMPARGIFASRAPSDA